MANPMTKEQKQWIFVSIMFAAIILVAFYYLYYKKSVSDYDMLSKKKTVLENDVKRYKEIAEGPDTQSKINELTFKIQQFEQRLPSAKEVPKLLDFLKEAADSADINYSKIAALPTIQGQYYLEVPYSMVFIGKYHNIGHLINQIENHTRLLKVDDIDVTASRAYPFRHQMRLKLVTYVYNSPQAVTLTENKQEAAK